MLCRSLDHVEHEGVKDQIQQELINYICINLQLYCILSYFTLLHLQTISPRLMFAQYSCVSFQKTFKTINLLIFKFTH